MEQSQGVESNNGDGAEIVLESPPFDSLPEDCIANFISFTSPREACVSASVSKAFESAVKSNIVWEKFIPSEIQYLIPLSLDVPSKKDLYFSLCNDPLLFENGQKSLWLEKGSGKSCIMLSSKQLEITWGDDPRYWEWIQLPESKFERVAELINVCWFEIRGRTNTHVLSPKTRYSAYIVFKKVDECYGFENAAIKAEVGIVGQEASRKYVCFDNGYMDTEEKDAEEEDTEEEDVEEEDAEEEDAEEEDTEEGDVEEEDAEEEDTEEEDVEDEERRNLVKPEERGDGWMEIELGEFFNEGEFMKSDDIEIRVLHMDGRSWKRGLIIQGIEIRPAK